MSLVVVDDPAVAKRWPDPVVLPAEQEPARDVLRELVRRAAPDGLVVAGTVGTLNRLVEAARRAALLGDLPFAFVPAATDPLAMELADELGLTAQPHPADPAVAGLPAVPLPLVRTDVGGVVLAQASLRPASGSRFGAQAYHDDQRVADGGVRRIDVRPDHRSGERLRVTITPPRGRQRLQTSTGRALQVACDPARLTVDGLELAEVTGRTWFVDQREHWLLRGALPSVAAEPGPGGPTGVGRRLRRWARMDR